VKTIPLLLFLISAACHAQNKPHGVYNEYNSDKSVYASRQYDSGKRSGAWVTNHHDGSRTFDVYRNDTLVQALFIGKSGDTVTNERYEHGYLPVTGIRRTFIYKKDMLAIKKIYSYKGHDSIVETLDTGRKFRVTYHVDSARNRIFTHTDRRADFKGGVNALMAFFSENLEYPADAKKAGIQGKVMLKFCVEIDGTVSNIKIVEGPMKHVSLEKEAVRVLMKSSGKWVPGSVNGKPVRSICQIPIDFSLE
jgi:TonB family protein